MSKTTSSKKKMTAAELLQELQANKDYTEQKALRERQLTVARADYREKEQAIVEDLNRLGYRFDSLDGLRRSGLEYKSIVPNLVKWLACTTDERIKESLVRTLSVPWAKPQAFELLVQLFRREVDNSATSLKWTIGSALELMADSSCVDEMVSLAQDSNNGKAREMVVLALGKFTDLESERTLITLLADDQVAGHAAVALSKRYHDELRQILLPFTHHQYGWVRDAVRKAVGN